MATEAPVGGVQKELRSKGALAKYREMATGPGGLLHFLAYETLNLLALVCPSSSLRAALFRPLFRHMGRGVRFGAHVLVRRPAAIELGDGVTLQDHVTLVAKSDASSIALGRGVNVGRHAILSCNGGPMQLGDGVRVGEHARLGSLKGLAIGEETVIEDRVVLSGAGHETRRLDVPIIMQPLTCKGPTRIGERVHIGRESTVLDGITIGDDVLVDPGSLVTRDVAPGLRVAGVPAKEVG